MADTTSTLNDALIASDRIRKQILELLDDKSVATNTRSTLVVAYFDIALEHQSAILVLIREKLYGSASALVRPIFEAWLRALWVSGCASDEDIKKIATDDSFAFPNDMVRAIDEKYASDGLFANIKKQSWKTMTSYSHPGQLAIGRRFTGSVVQSNYNEGELIEIVRSSTLASLLLLRLVLLINNLQAELKKSEEMTAAYVGVDAENNGA